MTDKIKKLLKVVTELGPGAGGLMGAIVGWGIVEFGSQPKSPAAVIILWGAGGFAAVALYRLLREKRLSKQRGTANQGDVQIPQK
jgi:hypothetical protein